MISKNIVLPFLILSLIFLLKCKDSPTQATATAPQVTTPQATTAEVGAPGSAPEQLAPSDTANGVARKPQFKWKAVDGADGYQLDASHGDQEVIHQRVDKANFTPDTALLGETTYYWRVRAINGETNGKWSDIHSFTTTDSISEQLSAPEQMTPSDKKKAVARKPQFTWKAVDGADGYQLDASHGNKEAIHQRVDKANFTPDTALLGETTYYWRVRAISGETNGKWSAIHSFITTTAAPEGGGNSTPVVSLLSPDDGASNQPVNLSLHWQSLSGINQYQVQVAPGSGFAGPVADETTGSTTYNLSGLDNNQTYYWRVQAAGDGNSNNWSTARSFRTKTAQSIGIGSSSSSSSSDRQALMDLYKATGGDQWTNNSGWGNGAPSNSWHGIKTNSQGRVTRIDLFKNNLRGQLPKSIGNLNEVTYLNVKNNHLTGTIPSEIGDMASLKTLILQGRTYEIGGTLKEPPENLAIAYHQGKHYSNTNKLSGTIPSTIGNLSNLELLEIANAPDIKGPIPSEIGNLSNLKGLYLSFDDFSGTTLPSSLGNLRNLKQLFIASAQLKGEIPASFKNLTQLLYLNLGESSNSTPKNHLTGEIPDFSNFTTLKYLDLTKNDFTGDFPTYFNNGNFTQLHELLLAWNNLTGSLPHFNNLQNLYSLTLDGNKLTGGIDNLTELPAHIKIIGVGWNNFSGNFPSNWPDFNQLKTTYMNDNNLTGNIPCSFWNKLDNPKLIIAWFKNNKFSGTCKSSANAMKGSGGIDLNL